MFIQIPSILPKKPRPPLGAKLGQGAFKIAYKHQTDPTKAVLVVHQGRDDYNLTAEVSSLTALQEAGVPVVQWHDVFRDEKTDQIIIITDLCLGSCRDLPREALLKLPEVFGPHTKESIEIIVKQLNESLMIVRDFQFLLTMDGRVVINDPQGITFQDQKYMEQNGPLWSVDQGDLGSFWKAVEYAQAIKSGMAPKPGTEDEWQNFFHNAHVWARDAGKRVRLAEEMAAAEETVQKLGIRTARVEMKLGLSQKPWWIAEAELNG